MSIICRKLNHRHTVILKDVTKEIKRFISSDASMKAEAWLKERGMKYITRETRLFTSRAQTISLITHDGENDIQPKELCGNSLLHITDDAGSDMVCTGEELHFLAKGISKLKIKLAKGIKP